MKNLPDRLKALRKQLGMTQAAFANHIGASRSYLSQLEGNPAKAKRPTPEFMAKIELVEKVAFARQLAEERATYSEQKRQVESNVALDPRQASRKIPILSWAQAGAAIDYDTLPFDSDDMEDYTGTDPKAYALRVKGDSMSPDFPPGTIITLSPQYPPTNKNLVVAGLKHEGAVFKEFHHSGDHKMVSLISYNPSYETIIRPREDFHFIHRVVSSRRKH